MTSGRSKWVDVDLDGLAALAARRPTGWWLYELVQNSLDEPGVTNVEVVILRRGASGLNVEIQDDAPDGWLNLSDAYMMFAPSKKRGNPELRGRFNLGEKLVLSVAERLTIKSTGGTLSFGKHGRRKSASALKSGTHISAKIRDTTQVPKLEEAAGLILTPRGVTLTVNGQTIEPRDPVGSTKVLLPTEIDDGTGHIRRTRRKTNVTAYRPRDGEKPMIYEMGIPICRHKGSYHLDVAQVVPMGMERDSVTPTYANLLHGATLELLVDADALTEDDAASDWASAGIAETHKAETVAAVVRGRFGEGAVTHSIRDPEANQAAMDAGRTVIPPRSFSKPAWEAIREANESLGGTVAPPSTKEFGSGVDTKAGGEPPISRDDWSDDMLAVAEWATERACACLDIEDLKVRYYRVDNGYQAWWTSHPAVPTLSINLGAAEVAAMFRDRSASPLLALIVHEMGHQLASNHYSHDFHEALCNIAAALAFLDYRSDEVPRGWFHDAQRAISAPEPG